MQNDLTKTMPVLICAETCQKDMFLRKYIFGVWPGGMRVALGIMQESSTVANTCTTLKCGIDTRSGCCRKA